MPRATARAALARRAANDRPALGAVMMGAMLLNLLLAALAGIAVPVFLDRAGRDPAHGASVLLTFATDSCGFFFFLGLAKLFLV